MDITQIDKNFKLQPFKEKDEDIVWLNANDTHFDVRGVFYSEEEGLYRRFPHKLAQCVSESLEILSTHTPGGRVRFLTNSPFVAIKCVVPKTSITPHQTPLSFYGFSIYENDKYAGSFMPDMQELINAPGQDFAFQDIRYFPDHLLQDMCIYMPLYGGVKELFIGVKKGSTVQTASPYPINNPVLFYGSSITQGGCASHAGTDYPSILSRKFGFDFINFGLSGNAKGELVVAKYLASLHPSVFVMDYDHNAPNAEHLQNTHYAMYQAFRKENPKTPVIFISRPDFENNVSLSVSKRTVIYETYVKARQNKDKNVFFIDGEKLFGKKDRDGCTVDLCHPNDLGFYRMAETIAPVLKKALKRCK